MKELLSIVSIIGFIVLFLLPIMKARDYKNLINNDEKLIE